jgi:hypothetical protein
MIEVFNQIPCEITVENVIKAMQLKVQQPKIEHLLRELMKQIVPIAKPKALYKVAYIDNKEGDSVVIDGIVFQSHVLRMNLDKVERVFAYIATCGNELDSFDAEGDVIKNFCIDAIRTVAVGVAVNYLHNHVKSRYALGKTAHMNPGSLKDWPITQQKQLFSLFEGNEQMIGVKLTEGCMISPMKSVSGFLYTSEVKFENCQLCPRENCIGRRAPYSIELVKIYENFTPS